MKVKNLTIYFKKNIVTVSLLSIFGNVILALLKLFAGISAHSGAMISDAVHSFSDVFSSIIVIAGNRIAAKKPDRNHPYGHERFESVATMILGVVLAVTGILIGRTAILSILSGQYQHMETPGVLALVIAGISIVSKEAMYWYTRAYAKKIDSDILMADAWHHHSDALSSVGALIGIAGARMGYPILEQIASLAICLFILKAAVDIFHSAIDQMVDRACDPALENEIISCVEAVNGVLGIDLIHTRKFGGRIYVDIEIRMDKNSSLLEAHDTAEEVHSLVEQNFRKVKHVMVHVNPSD